MILWLDLLENKYRWIFLPYFGYEYIEVVWDFTTPQYFRILIKINDQWSKIIIINKHPFEKEA